MDKLGDQLRRIILAAGITRAELSRRTGIDQAVLSRFIHGRSMSLRNLDTIGQYLGLKVIRAQKGKVK